VKLLSEMGLEHTFIPQNFTETHLHRKVRNYLYVSRYKYGSN